jgi:hypothetical protein
MCRVAIMVMLISAPAMAGEMCAVVVPESAVDRAFISAMGASRIEHSRPRTDWLCFDETNRAAVSALRERVHAENPQSCVTFEDPSHLETVEKELRRLTVANWREKPVKLCYLSKDAAVVEKAMSRAVKPSKGA